MRIINRIIENDQKCREKLKAGIDKVFEIVSSTLGPKGRNVIIEQKSKPPLMTNDGFYIAREIILEDETENTGAQAIINVAKQQNSMVGDGTTTSIVLAWDIINRVFKELQEAQHDVDGGGEAMERRKKILESCDNVVKELKKIAKPIKTKEDIEKVAFTSLEDPKMAGIVSEMAYKMGKDGCITVEQGYGYETKTEIISGMKFLGKYIDEKLSTNDRKEAVIEDPLILITNEYIENPLILKNIAEGLIKTQGKPQMVLIAQGFSKNVIPTIVLNALRQKFYCLAISAGSLTTGEYEDLCFYTGANFFDINKACVLSKVDVQLGDFGKAKKVITDRDKTFVIDGKGKQSVIKERITQLKIERDEVEKDDRFKKRIDKRISALSGGVGLIEVASKSDVEVEYIRNKVEDAVYACRAAMEDGVVKGGGLALKQIADKLPDDDILKEPLKAPYNLIQKNAGKDLKIGEGIIDPIKVVKLALENACAFAGIFITVSNSIVWARSELSDKFRDIIREEFSAQ